MLGNAVSGLLRRHAPPFLERAGECAVRGIAREHGDVDKPQAGIVQVGFGQLIANEIHLAAKAGAGLPQPALERPRQTPQLGADPRDVRLSIADGAGDCARVCSTISSCWGSCPPDRLQETDHEMF